MITVGDLRRWRPGGLESAADDVAAARRRVDRSAEALDDAARAVARSWHGAAGEAAWRVVRLRARRAAALAAATAGVGRGMTVGADRLAAAITTLERASRLAAEHGLRITDAGAVVPGAGGSGAGRAGAGGSGAGRAGAGRAGAGHGAPVPDVVADASGAAAQVRAMVQAALTAAGAADDEAAHLVRAAVRAVGHGGADAGVSAGGALWRFGGHRIGAGRGARRVPPPGTPPAEVARWWAALPVAERTRLLTEHPEQVGNLDGVPLHERALANRSVIVETLAQERRLAARLAAHAEEPGGLGAAALLAACRRRIARYEDLIAEPTIVGWDASGAPVRAPGHQVVLFDPAGGRFAEVVGSLGAATTSVGILLGGAGTDLGNMSGQYDRAMSFVAAARPHGSLAVVTYLGGDMPQGLDDAAANHAARVIGPRLADFVAGMDRPDDASLTVVGHSYGGSVVGAAEVAGLDVDRVVHVESAGGGPDVGGVGDYAHPGTERFSMTAPGDPIALVQGRQLGGLGHGADPDLLRGVTRLETGYMRAGDPSSGRIDGPWSHSGVFTEGSTAWRNILDAMTGRPVLAEGAVP